MGAKACTNKAEWTLTHKLLTAECASRLGIQCIYHAKKFMQVYVQHCSENLKYTSFFIVYTTEYATADAT